MMKTMTQGGTRDEDPEHEIDVARRKLLRAAVYVAPVIVSSVVVDRASAQVSPSCAPSTCTPSCAPNNCTPLTCPPRTR